MITIENIQVIMPRTSNVVLSQTKRKTFNFEHLSREDSKQSSKLPDNGNEYLAVSFDFISYAERNTNVSQ